MTSKVFTGESAPAESPLHVFLNLVQSFAKTASKQSGKIASGDATAASWGKESLVPEGLARRPCGTWVLISNNVWNLRATTVETLLGDT
jgi:hypothetical protein